MLKYEFIQRPISCSAFQLNGTIHKKDISEENVRLLEKEKCQLFEILEWPKVLQIEKEKLERKIVYLKSKNLPISVGHLKCVQAFDNHHDLFRGRLKKYHKITYGKIIFGTKLLRVMGCFTDSRN